MREVETSKLRRKVKKTMCVKKNKKIQKKLWGIIIAATMLCTGCGTSPSVPVVTSTPVPTLEPTVASTPTPEPTATNTPTPEPIATSTPTPEPTATSTPTPEPTATSTPTPEPTATSTPAPEPTATSTPTPEPTATNIPTPEPTATSTPTPKPTATSTPAPTPTPISVSVFTENYKLELGMSVEELKKEIGTPAYTMPAEYEKCEWYVYNENYTNLIIVLIQGKKVAGIYVDGPEFAYREITTETTPEQLKGNEYLERANYYCKEEGNAAEYVFIDKLGDNTAEGLLVLEKNMYQSFSTVGKEATLERISFEVTNSFRVKYGLPGLEWSDEAADVARAHSADMNQNGFFAHESFDGTEFSDRMTRAGIEWRACAENIAAGYNDGFFVTYAWINSAGHRSNILYENVTRLGVGVVEGNAYSFYYTQDFYSTFEE